MKTTEEKAKAYDEVVNKLRRFMEQGIDPLITRADAQDFFHELKESEDERIRKVLIELSKEVAQEQFFINRGTNLQNVIAWLEKQGEQKPQRMISAEAKEAMYDKPADTVEPKFKVGDKIYLKPEYRMPNDDTPIANTVKEIRRIDDKHYRFDGSYIFIEDQDKYELVEQKPAWSEEDEQHIDSLLKRLDALCRNKFERTRFAISEDRDWLKSLRPQNKWKPSDEQMEALDWQVENTSVGSWQYKATKKLMADLKKLKGEV